MVDTFTVHAGTFIGPLELLLNLIEDRKLHISEVSLATVADDFLEHIQAQETIPTADMAHFVLVAATLILIKSRALLPTLELSKEEEQDVSELAYRLRMYKEIKDATKTIQSIFGKRGLFLHEDHYQAQEVFVPDEAVTSASLRTAIGKVVNEFPVATRLARTVVEKVISLEDMIKRLHSRVKEALHAQFSDMVEPGTTEREQRLNVAVTFLALLELVKQQQIAVSQSNMFSDIAIDHLREETT